jgi:mRNA interferase MazF
MVGQQGRYIPDRGHIILLDFDDPSVGHEQAGRRPAIVLSLLAYNGKVGLAVVCPITKQAKGYPWEVPLPTGLRTQGVVLADQIKSLDWRIRDAEFVEQAPTGTVQAIQLKIRPLLF